MRKKRGEKSFAHQVSKEEAAEAAGEKKRKMRRLRRWLFFSFFRNHLRARSLATITPFLAHLRTRARAFGGTRGARVQGGASHALVAKRGREETCSFVKEHESDSSSLAAVVVVISFGPLRL